MKKTFFTLLNLFIFIGISLGQGVAPTDSDGNGKLEIATKQNLLYLSQNPAKDWTANYEQTADIVFTTTDFDTGGDFFNDGKGFSPIGNSFSNKFSGSYDGKEHTITGLKINRPSQDLIGFFGICSPSSSISNLGMLNSSIDGNKYVGGVVGNNGGIITNCYNTGNVTGTDERVGGIAGSTYGTIKGCYNTGIIFGKSEVAGIAGLNSLIIINCYNTGNINATNDYIGGIAGYNNHIIANCYNTGNISGLTYIGGIAGLQKTNSNEAKTTKNCYNTGAVSGTSSVGGVIGESEGLIKNCYNIGSVEAIQGGTITCSNSGTIENSFWNTETTTTITNGVYSGTTSGATGKTTAEMKLQSTFTDAAWDFVGENTNGTENVWCISSGINDGYPSFYTTYGEEPPIVGGKYQISTKAHLLWLSQDATADWTADYEQTADIAFTAADFETGGDFYNGGEGFSPIGNEPNRFSGSYDGLSHTITGLKINRPSQYFIGFFGYTASASTISNLGLIDIFVVGDFFVGSFCGYNFSNVNDLYSTGTILGNSFIGGFCGANKGTVTDLYFNGSVTGNSFSAGFCGENKGSVNNSYSTALVNGTGSNIGGFIGANYGITNNCFWDTEVSGKATSAGTEIGKTTAGMKNLCTFSDATWDFETTPVWTMSADNNGYPALAWQGLAHTATCVIYEKPPLVGGKYVIYTKAHLLWLSQSPDKDWSANYEQITDIVFEAADFETGGDFYNNGKGFSPIGIDMANPFEGTYDGLNHSITGLTIHSDETNVAMFKINSGSIRNLGLVDVDITGDYTVAALCAENYSGGIESCYSTGTIQGVATLGGLVGSNSNGTITNSYSTCTVTGETTNHSSQSIGGFCGANSEFGEITNSYATGNVSGSEQVGGFCGFNDGGTIENAYATGSASGQRFVGGFCGYIYNAYIWGGADDAVAFIKKAYSTGEVIAAPTSYTDVYIGGFIGANPDGYDILNSFWNTETSNQAQGFDPSSTGTNDITGLSISDMQNQNIFVDADWDFTVEPIWKMSSISKSNGYPALEWEVSSIPVCVWNGTAWSPNPPTATDNAIIDGNYSQTQSFKCTDLTINSGKTLNILNHVEITVNGTLTNNAGITGLIIEDGGSLIHSTANVPATIKKNIEGGESKAYNYSMLGTPIKAFPVQNIFNGDYVYSYNSSTTTQETAWENLATGDQINVMKGYLVYSTSAKTLNFKGGMNEGDLNYPTEAGFNLISNPYPSPIKWSDIAAANSNLTNDYCYWKNADRKYIYYNGTMQVPVVTTGQPDLISVGQAFFVKSIAKAIPSGVNISNSMRIHPSDHPTKKQEAITDRIRFSINNEEQSDELAIYFAEKGNNVSKFFSFTEKAQIYIGEKDNALVINKNTSLTNNENQSISLGFTTNKSGIYTILAFDFEKLNSEFSILLEDVKTGKTINLRKNSDYKFFAEKGTFDNRFILHLKKGVATTEDLEKSDIQIYTSQKILFINSSELILQNIEIYDVSGKLISSKKLNSSKENINISNYNKGIFIVKTTTNKGVFTEKIILL